MIRNLYTSALLTLIQAANSLFAVVPEFKAPKLPPFSHYEGILQRMPFGAGPPPDAEMALSPEDAKDAAKEEIEKQKLARQINMSCVNITPSGIPAVGFSDLSEKTPVNFYLLVGASGGGWSLLSASYEEEWAELEKDGTTIFVKLGKGLMDGPPVEKNFEDILPIIINSPKTPVASLLQKACDEKNISSSDIEVQLDKSYLERLRDKHNLKKPQVEADKKATIEKFKKMAKKIAQEEVEKKSKEITIHELYENKPLLHEHDIIKVP